MKYTKLGSSDLVVSVVCLVGAGSAVMGLGRHTLPLTPLQCISLPQPSFASFPAACALQGTMTFGVQNNEEDAWAQLDYAVSQGVNFIDTGGGPRYYC